MMLDLRSDKILDFFRRFKFWPPPLRCKSNFLKKKFSQKWFFIFFYFAKIFKEYFYSFFVNEIDPESADMKVKKIQLENHNFQKFSKFFFKFIYVMYHALKRRKMASDSIFEQMWKFFGDFKMSTSPPKKILLGRALFST